MGHFADRNQKMPLAATAIRCLAPRTARPADGEIHRLEPDVQLVVVIRHDNFFLAEQLPVVAILAPVKAVVSIVGH